MIADAEDTIVALSSPPGPGQRAIVRMSGKKTREISGQIFQPSIPAKLRRHFIPGELVLNDVTSPLPAELYFFAAPNTYTSQDIAEFHLVSSPPLINQLITDLLALGCRAAQPGEFTLRSFLSGKIDLTQAEAVYAVIEASTQHDLKQSLLQLAGGVRRPLDQLRDDLLNLLADVEAGLDFVDEDIEFVTRSELLQRVNQTLTELHQLHQQMARRSVSHRNVRVVLAGLPNAGKSSVFNALTGSKALVSDESGTTRDYLCREFQLDEWTVELIDTAGWASARSVIEDRAQSLGSEQRDLAELVLWCVPAGESIDDTIFPFGPDRDVILVRTKCDLVSRFAPSETSLSRFPVVHVSTRTDNGLAPLLDSLREQLEARRLPALAPSLSRCQDHMGKAIRALESVSHLVSRDDPAELIALELRIALDQIGEMAGTVYTNDLLDRIFSRFCIGK